MTGPENPIAAVIHPDPYPFYADLARSRPFERDGSLGLWVAASAEAVSAVLASDLGRVRPAAEPVPKALVGSPAGEIFGRLVRMNDGAGHEAMKQAVGGALAALDLPALAEQSALAARNLAAEVGLANGPERLMDFLFDLSPHAVASRLGARQEDLPEIALDVAAFVHCLAPGSTPEEIESGKVAADRLIERFERLLDEQQAAGGEGLLAQLAEGAKRANRASGLGLDPGETRKRAVMNGIGFLSQAYEATAGLIGNALVTLAAEPQARARVESDPGLVRPFLKEVIRFDPPVQNTRRFLAADGEIAGREVKKDDAILVVLAAANRDPAANPDPDRFDLDRTNRRSFTFGLGIHGCPGEEWATTIAAAGVAEILRAALDLEGVAGGVGGWRYRGSVNTRVPLLDVRE